MGYFKTTVFGVTWSVAQRWVIRGLTIVRLAVLARVLSPVQFGVFGVATMVLGFLETLTETAINIFLVQEKGDIDEYINTAWVISVFRGLVIGILIYLTAGPVSGFFHSPDSLPVIRLMALVPIFRGLINPSVAKLQKQLLFRDEFIYRSVLFMVDGSVSILVSILSRNAIGLVAGMLASALTEMLLSYYLFRPRPCWQWNRDRASKTISRGKWITAAGLFNYLYSNLDNLVVGRMLGETALGIYSSAYKLSSLPVSEVSDVVSRVTFPVYARLTGTRKALKQAFYRSSFAVISISGLMGITVFMLADLLVRIILGPGWMAAIPILRLLSVYGVIKSVSNTIYPLFLAINRQEYITLINLSSCLILGLTIMPMVSRSGMVGAGIAAISGAVAALVSSLYYLHRSFRYLHEDGL